MKKRISKILIILVLIVLILSKFSFASEIQPRTSTEEGVNPISELAPEDSEQNQTTTQPEYDITYEDLYVFEDGSYEMDKLIEGNAFIVANGDVRFTGEVAGSVFIIANGNVEIEKGSYIAASLFVVAKQVKVAGAVYDIYSLSQKFELMEDAYISRSVKLISDDVKLRGTIYRDINLTAKNIDVKDEMSALIIGGDFNYVSEKQIEGLQDVVLYGEINFELQKENKDIVSIQDKIIEYIYKAITSIVYVLIIYLLLLLIAPKFKERIGIDLKEKSIIDFAVGLVSWLIVVVAIIVALILIFTSFGSPITIIASIIMFTSIYISSAIFSISILDLVKAKVEKINGNKGLEIITLAGIAFIVWILQQLPYIGGVITFIVLTTGLGLIVRNIIAKKEKDNTSIEKVEK